MTELVDLTAFVLVEGWLLHTTCGQWVPFSGGPTLDVLCRSATEHVCER
jgi:hypothetical protein